MAVASSGRAGRNGGGVAGAGYLALRSFPQHLANVLTLARLLCAVPLVLLIGAGRLDIAFYVFVVAAVSDVLDGWIAKRFNGCSSVGAILDPAADKIFAASVFFALWAAGAVPSWFLALVLVRDAILVVGSFILRQRVDGFRVEPLVIGKLCTFLQLLFAGFMLGQMAGIAEVGWIVDPLMLAAAAVTLVSAVAYVGMGVRIGTAAPGGPA